jgi:hypothetical protein
MRYESGLVQTLQALAGNLTGKYNFLAASCCNVEVVKGPSWYFLVGFVSNLQLFIWS